MMAVSNHAVRIVGLAAGALVLAACTPAVETTVVADGPQSISKDDRLASVLADERRSVDRKRDKYRHPVETLDFFQITADQTVIEYAPGGGWYTRILAPYLSCDGQYIAVSFSPDDVATLNADFRERLHEGGRTFSATQSRALGIPEERLPFHFGDAVPDELDGTVDRVLIVHMLHNLMRWDIAESEIAALRDTLKPDGMVGVVQHRAKPDAPDEFSDGNAGYLKEADVIAFFENNGFELVASSEVNANPADTADHEAGVWTLPPTFALGDKARDKFAEIGESDRMTLLFSKAE